MGQCESEDDDMRSAVAIVQFCDHFKMSILMNKSHLVQNINELSQFSQESARPRWALSGELSNKSKKTFIQLKLH